MELNDDVWIEIKKFLFHRHLWNVPLHQSFTRVITDLPKLNMPSREFSFFVTSSVDFDKYIKIHEHVTWCSRYVLRIVSYTCVPKSSESRVCEIMSPCMPAFDVYV